MAVDETSLERIRNATFPSERRGYDKREVEKFLHRLADWLETGGSDADRSGTMRRELERVGQRSGTILADAEESAQKIREEAEREAADSLRRARADADAARKEAEAYVTESRLSADGYSEKVRKDADTYVANARKLAERHGSELRSKAEEESASARKSAKAEAARIGEAAAQRRRDLESVIGDLTDRRDKVIEQIEGLSRELRSALSEHGLGESGDRPKPAPEVAKQASKREAAAKPAKGAKNGPAPAKKAASGNGPAPRKKSSSAKSKR
jgi:DivIVA domain-containing protein